MEFGTTTGELSAVSDWLVERGVTPVGMEATGVCIGNRWIGVLEGVIGEAW